MNNDQKQKQQEFVSSCPPLEDMLDGIRDIEGFPIAKDKDILALSDSPWYTACPNPYINKFIETFGTPYDEETDDYERTPFVSDVSEGKHNPIYNAHTYHTKVPHKAIIPFIEHYTKEGDIVFDGFCGTGMVGVAAQILNRKPILSDLSPAATFIAYNYNTPIDVEKFKQKANKIIKELEDECGYMYETLHTDGVTKARINYTVWSDIFICPFCENEYVFWDGATDLENRKVKNEFPCPHCQSSITKKQSERAKITYFDSNINKDITQTKQVPVLINYSIGKEKYEKTPDQFDLELIKKIESIEIPYWIPTNQMMNVEGKWGDTWRAGYHFGITHVHHFYSKRNLWVLALWLEKCKKNKVSIEDARLLMTLTGVALGESYLNRFLFKETSFPFYLLSGTLYIGSFRQENYPIKDLKNKSLLRLTKINSDNSVGGSLISTSSATNCNIKNNSIDYIFTDPPFGNNLMYSELNFLWESWLKVLTNNNSEAIMNSSQSKSLSEYKDLMTDSFKEMYRILKPNRWITVEFHNSKASVWNAIQDAMTKAGFIVAQVSILDKKQGSFKQVTSAGAVKNDLVINAYKPKQRFEERFLRTAGEGLEKDFIEQHLEHLPIVPNVERTEQMLFSKMLAHYVQKGYEIRMDAKKFYELLRDSFKLMDGFWFNNSQIREYDEWKKDNGLQAIEEISAGQQTLFVSDEKSAIIWLYNFLGEPKNLNDILMVFNQVTTNIDDQIPELQEILQTNFIYENGLYRRPLTEEEKDAKEEQSEKELLRAFEKIVTEVRSSKKKIKTVRKEAVRVGFTKAYQQKRFADIVMVADRLNQKIIDNNSEIGDFVDIARIKLGDEF